MKTNPDKERTKLVPYEEVHPEPKKPETPKEMGKPIFELNLADVPDLSGKKKGDTISLQIDVQIENIDDDKASLQLINAKDISKESIPEKQPIDKSGMSDREVMASNLETNPAE